MNYESIDTMRQMDISIINDVNTAFLSQAIVLTDDDINDGQTTAERLPGAIDQSQLAYVFDTTLYGNSVNQSVTGSPILIGLSLDGNYSREATDQEQSVATDEASINSRILMPDMPITLHI